jgi:hypothetical protein
MIQPALFAIALFGSGSAFAWDTEPVTLTLTDQVPLMEGAAYETGYVPSGSPVMVNFALEADELARVSMSTLAGLVWPEAVTLVWEPQPQTGTLGLFGALSTVIYLKLDLWGYQGEWELDRRSIEVLANTVFDPLVLADSPTPEVHIEQEGLGTTAFTIGTTVLSVVDINLDVDLAATLDTTMAGVEIQHDDEVQRLEADVVVLDVPDTGYLEVTSTYMAAWDTSMQVLIQPGVEVCVDIIGCYEWDDIFDIPVDMGQASFDDAFDPVTYDFRLPVMAPPDESHDFGEVTVGELANWNVELRNGGVELLAGEAGITGSEYFSVYPDFILADADSYDGLVVTFAPQSPGPFNATLLLASNDPAHPTYSVELTGTGVEDVEESTTIPAEVGCGCSGGGRPLTGLWLLGLAPLLVRRRRAGA